MSWISRSRIVGLSVAVLAGATLPLAVTGTTLAGASPVGCTNNFTASQSSIWSNAQNWSAGHVPTSSDVVCLALVPARRTSS
jgi:hypothetical protein